MNKPVCPNCSSEVEVTTRSAIVKQCAYCESALVVNEQAIRLLGDAALLTDTPSCLAVGWPATVKGKEVFVRGRIQYQYPAGVWDEWWVEYDDGETAWISQDEGRYMLEHRVTTEVDVKAVRDLKPGDTFRISGHTLWVQERNVALVAGYQGELPFAISPDEEMLYFDLTDNKFKATIEVFADDEINIFFGEHLSHHDLRGVDPDDIEQFGDRIKRIYHQPALNEPQVYRVADTVAARAINCPSCGGSVTINGAQAAMITCTFCGEYLDVTVSDTVRLLKQKLAKQQHFCIPTGSTCHFRGVDYTVLGRIQYVQYDEGTYYWTAVQMYNPERGYAFLEEENGHWLFFAPLTHTILIDPRYRTAKQGISYYGQSYVVFERGNCQVCYVEGELSWVARVGDTLEFLDAIRPPYMLSAEWSDTEMEWSLGNYVEPAEIQAAFGDQIHSMPRRTGIAPAQPFKRSRNQRWAMWAGLAFAALFFCLWAANFVWPGKTILPPTAIPASAYRSPEGFVTNEFEIPSGSHICKITTECNGLSNQWVAVGFAFVDDNDQVLLDTDAEVEYYSGTEGGESWSEGSKRDYKLVRLTGPKKYRLHVFGQSGSWSRAGGDRTDPEPPSNAATGKLAAQFNAGKTTPRHYSGKSITISLQRGVGIARYYFFAAIIALIYPVIELIRTISFSTQKWSDD